MKENKTYLHKALPGGYPEPDEYFSPSEAYPEYPFEHVATKPNRVYEDVRNLFRQMRLDKDNFGTSEWNPLSSEVWGIPTAQ